jgi:hypothetical protein
MRWGLAVSRAVRAWPGPSYASDHCPGAQGPAEDTKIPRQRLNH